MNSSFVTLFFPFEWAFLLFCSRFDLFCQKYLQNWWNEQSKQAVGTPASQKISRPPRKLAADMTNQEAATIIQKAWRKHIVRKSKRWCCFFYFSLTLFWRKKANWKWVKILLSNTEDEYFCIVIFRTYRCIDITEISLTLDHAEIPWWCYVVSILMKLNFWIQLSVYT